MLFILIALCSCVFQANGDNIALGKPTWASSVSSGGAGGAPQRAVDGNQATNFLSYSCTQTNQETNPWWAVDLGSNTTVNLVSITNRADMNGYRLNNFAVALSDLSPSTTTPSPANYRICALYNGVVGDGQTLPISCTGSSVGRYLIIQILGNLPNYLTLCEVQVASNIYNS